MNVLVDKQGHEKTGIKTSTFYCQNKLKILPRVIKLKTKPIQATKIPYKSDKACKKDSKRLQKNRKKKVLMSTKGCGKKDCKKTSADLGFERLTNCKVSDITELKVGKRPWTENDLESGRICKKPKLDLNENFKPVKKCLNEEFLSEQELETGESCIKQKVVGDKEINSVDESRLCNISNEGDVRAEKKQTTFESDKQKDGNDAVSSLCDNADFPDEIVQINVESSTTVNRNNKNVLKNSADEIFETLLSSGDSCSQREAKTITPSKILPKTNNECLTNKRRELFHLNKETKTKLCNTSEVCKHSENDIFGSPRPTCPRTYSLKGSPQRDRKSLCSSVGNVTEKELVDEVKETEDNIFGTPASASKFKSVEEKTSKNSGEILTVDSSLTSSFENKIVSRQEAQNNKRTPRLRLGSIDAFVFVQKTPVSKADDRPKDSGFHEPFRILNETSSQESGVSSSTETSPLLFSQSSTSSSSSVSSKAKSNSPESQSSITKYFTPLRKGSSITTVLNNVSPSSDRKARRQTKGRKINSPTDSPVSSKKEQMFLDLGQKNFGHITCPTCNMVYTSAQPEDEAHHVKFHHKVVSSLRFNGWKTERVVEHFDDGRVIVVLPQDPQSHLKKVSSVRAVVDEELGFSSETTLRMQDSKTYMFIADKKVVGCVVAVVIQEGFPLLPCSSDGERISPSEQGAWCCSSAPVRAQCGISRVWVLQQYRRKKIATRLLDCVRNDFMFGGLVSKELLAFSDPTPLGKQLAESYCGTENFLVFR